MTIHTLNIYTNSTGYFCSNHQPSQISLSEYILGSNWDENVREGRGREKDTCKEKWERMCGDFNTRHR